MEMELQQIQMATFTKVYGMKIASMDWEWPVRPQALTSVKQSSIRMVMKMPNLLNTEEELQLQGTSHAIRELQSQ